MSRKGNKVILFTKEVALTHEGDNLTVKGPKGELSLSLKKGIHRLSLNIWLKRKPTGRKALPFKKMGLIFSRMWLEKLKK